MLGPLHTRPTEPVRPLEERLTAARNEVEGELLEEHHASLDGEARLHLVLEHGRCYRLWVGADRPVDVHLEDEHGHVIARGPAWLREVCPRWTGSFALVVASEEDARSFAVLLAGRSMP